jgi:hypothetical protein
MGLTFVIFLQYVQEKRVERLKLIVIDQNRKLKMLKELEI